MKTEIGDCPVSSKCPLSEVCPFGRGAKMGLTLCVLAILFFMVVLVYATGCQNAYAYKRSKRPHVYPPAAYSAQSAEFRSAVKMRSGAAERVKIEPSADDDP